MAMKRAKERRLAEDKVDIVTTVKEKVGDQPVVQYDEVVKAEKPQPLPGDKCYSVELSRAVKIGGHSFEKGEVVATMTCKYGLLPRVIFEHVGRLYGLKEDTQQKG